MYAIVKAVRPIVRNLKPFATVKCNYLTSLVSIQFFSKIITRHDSFGSAFQKNHAKSFVSSSSSTIGELYREQNRKIAGVNIES
jgi:hypothetical protein